MKRLHVHVSVNDLSESVRFYRGLFAAEPTVLKHDYAKWMLDDPRVNFAISTRSNQTGLNHLGIQVESLAELDEIEQRATNAGLVSSPKRSCTVLLYWRLVRRRRVFRDGPAARSASNGASGKPAR